MKIYKVGGSVRDRLITELRGTRLEQGDIDHVVVGATPKILMDRGFMPVGSDFPVFLHPKTHEEYALARTERKTAPGYKGFVFNADISVTLEEDLARRDLTINAIAEDDDGNTIDPYGGTEDIRNGILRHVSPAFGEDPVRILRIARFAAKFPDFGVHPQTAVMLKGMVDAGEADALVAERVWAEVKRGLMEKAPVRMLKVLADCGYWERAFPFSPADETVCRTLEITAGRNLPLQARAAVLFTHCASLDDKTVREILTKLRADSDTIELSVLYTRELSGLVAAKTAEDYAGAFARCDLLRRRERFEQFLSLAEITVPGTDSRFIARLAAAFASVNAGDIARTAPDKSQIPALIMRARTQAVQKSMENA